MKLHSLKPLATALLLLPLAPLANVNEPAPRLAAPPPLDRKIALHGVSEPLPPNLKFLDDQGGWHTPFIHPGMPGPYDLRGWHATPPSSRQHQK